MRCALQVRMHLFGKISLFNADDDDFWHGEKCAHHMSEEIWGGTYLIR